MTRLDMDVPFRRRVITISPQPEQFAWRTWSMNGEVKFHGHHGHADEFEFKSVGDALSYLRRWRFNWTAKVWH